MKRIAVLCAALGLCGVSRAQTPPRPPLDRVEILGRLGVGYPPSYIAKLVKTRGVNFAPSPDFVYRVRLAGGAGILVDRLSSAEPSTGLPGSSAQDPHIDRLAKCAELAHSKEESAELECRAATDENGTSAWPLLILARVLLENKPENDSPSQTDEDRAKRAALTEVEKRAVALAANASFFSTFQVVAEIPSNPAAATPVDEEDFDALESPIGWSENALGASRLPTPSELNQSDSVVNDPQVVDLAVSSLIDRIQHEPDLASNHVTLALQYEQLRDFEKAISELREAEALEPDNLSLHILNGIALFKHREGEAAVAELRDAVRIAPSGASENMTLAGLYELLGRTPEAIAQLQQAINLRPTNAILSEALVTEFVQHKDRKAAIAELRRSLAADYAKNQDDATLVKSRGADESDLAQLLIQDKRFDEATAQYRYLIQVEPDYSGWHNDYGNFLFQTHKCDEAMDEYQQALRLASQIGMTYSNMAMCSTEKKDYEAAIDQLKRALELTPNDPGAENNLAWLYCIAENPKFRNPKDALRLVQHALEAQPANPNFLDTLAEAELLNGNAAQALEAETKALANDPENEELQKRILRFREAAATTSTQRP